jgi:hypothetical protein
MQILIVGKAVSSFPTSVRLRCRADSAVYKGIVVPILQCFCDEGGKYQKDAIVSLSGVLISPLKLQEFDAEWRSLLAAYELSSLHMGVVRDLYSAHGPKMPKDQTTDQRTSALLPFADCINKYIEVGFVEAWDVNAYIRLPTEAKGRLGGSLDPHYLALTIRSVSFLTMTSLRRGTAIYTTGLSASPYQN